MKILNTKQEKYRYNIFEQFAKKGIKLVELPYRVKVHVMWYDLWFYDSVTKKNKLQSKNRNTNPK